MTPSGSNSNTPKTLAVAVSVNGQDFAATCKTSGYDCGFSHLTSQTPVVDSVTPSDLTLADHNITITGSNLGSNTDDVTIMIGDVMCDNVQFTTPDTEITCQALEAVQGTQDFSLHVAGMGKASSSVSSLDVSALCISFTHGMLKVKLISMTVNSVNINYV